MGQLRARVGILVLALLALVAAAGYLILSHAGNGPIPADIKKSFKALIFYPSPKDTGFKITPNTVKYDPTSKVVSYVAERAGTKLTVSEQTTPESFVDIPQAYDKLLEKMHGYYSFDSASGKVTLTRPEELKGVQLAVNNNKGTLLFIRSEPDLPPDEWRQMFNSMHEVH
jgi:hypothetical protein